MAFFVWKNPKNPKKIAKNIVKTSILAVFFGFFGFFGFLGRKSLWLAARLTYGATATLGARFIFPLRHNYSRAWLSLRLKERYCTFIEISSFAWQNHYVFNFEDPAIYSLANILRLEDLDQLIERAFK